MAKVRVPLLMFALALLYYGWMCAKEYTWIFVSSDSGDWLAASTWWMVPQPMGSPLYIILGHLVSLLPGDLALNMTLLLSVVPAALTVALVYLVVERLTSSKLIATTSSIVLIGAAVFLTQATVLEEYALTSMLTTLSFWLYLKDRRTLASSCLGLAIAVHVIVIGVLIFWLMVEKRRYLVHFLAITTPIVVSFYSLIPILMYLNTPRLLAGSLTYEALKYYLTGTAGAIIGQISIFEFPERFYTAVCILLASFGVALVPLVVSWRRSYLSRPTLILLGTMPFWLLWYYITNLDPMTWTFLALASPSVAILVGIGLSYMEPRLVHVTIVAGCSLLMLGANAIALNANQLTLEQPLAREYKQALEALPDGSIVLVHAGEYSLGLYYTMSTGKDLIPLVHNYIESDPSGDIYGWLERNYGHRVTILPSTLATAAANVRSNRTGVYYAARPDFRNVLDPCLKLENTQWPFLRKVVGLTGQEPDPYLKEVKWITD